MKLFLTGITGFVGKRLAVQLVNRGYQLRAAVRNSNVIFDAGIQKCVFNDLASHCWKEALSGQDVVIHSAARVHVMADNAIDPLAEFRDVNVHGTINLARQAAEAGVRRFIFISSVKVNGEESADGKPYKADDTPAPIDFYGISKWEAEASLLQLASETGMEVTIVRPVLVYGSGVKGNFLSMIKLIEKGIPLPLGMVHNKRSLIGVDNLVDLIARCIDHPAAANQIFLASDGDDLSTAELLRGVSKALGKPCRLISVPPVLLHFSAGLIGQKAMAQRLLGNLQVDISKTCQLLDWTPPYSVEEGLKRCFSN